MLVVPSELDEVIDEMPEMSDSERSSGVATVDAIVSALAPGRSASIRIVGKSTCGNGATGNSTKATAPTRTRPSINNEVATGRFMNGFERFMT
jgi:hypothetical protein